MLSTDLALLRDFTSQNRTASLYADHVVVTRMKRAMPLDDYMVVLFRNEPSGWVAEAPSISGCYALMPTKAEALLELEQVFAMIEAEFRERGVTLPADTTEITHA
jgi:predicted RNase H-like HicB family nuclease